MSSWIPYPVAAVWTAAFAMVALVHLGHAAVMSGRHRLWHVGHVLMAAGMLVMFWPGEPLLGMSAGIGIWVYALAAGVLALGLVIAWSRHIRLGPLWLVSVVDFVAMAYMFAMMQTQFVWLSVLAAVWFAAQAIGWTGGWLGRVLERGGLGDLVPATRTASTPPATRRAESPPEHVTPAVERAADPGSAGGATMTARLMITVRRRVIDGGIRDWSVRITLAVMAAGMGYMILAMQFGMAEMGGMEGM